MCVCVCIYIYIYIPKPSNNRIKNQRLKPLTQLALHSNPRTKTVLTGMGSHKSEPK